MYYYECGTSVNLYEKWLHTIVYSFLELGSFKKLR